MKNIIIASISAVVFAASASALSFVTSVPSPEKATYTKTDWVSSINNPVKLKAKPGRNDTVTFRYSGGDFIIDSNVDVHSLGFYEEAFVVAERKKISALRGGLNFVISSNPNHTNRLWLKNSEMVVNGSISHSPTSGNKTVGMNVIRLDDSKFSASGSMDFTITSAIFNPVEGRSGVRIELIGDSQFFLKGSLLVDSLLADDKRAMFVLSFEEKGGKMPKMTVDKASIAGVDFDVIAKGELKKGKYTLLELSDRKEPDGMPRSYSINGKKVKLGDSVEVGANKVSIILDSADKKSANDFILSVE